MSYDVTVGSQEFNYTYNMGPFFRDFGVHPYFDLNGMNPNQALKAITDAFKRFTELDMEVLKEDYDASNGWGDVEGATRFLFEIYLACLTEPADIIIDVY